MKKIIDSVVILLLICSSFAGVFTIISLPQVSAYTPHDPISIDGDDDFAAQAASEGWPGDGTEGNPYIIEGYEIILDDGYTWNYHAIDIDSTEVHFVIRDSKISGNNPDQLIFLNNVKNGKIENCIIENGSLGIYIWAGRGNIIANNTLINNNLLFWETKENTFIANKFIKGGFEVRGFFLEGWNTHYIDTSNTINGKPVYYWKNRSGGIVPSGAGQVILVNCTNVVVENQELTNGSHGIILGYSSKNNIKWNNVDSNNDAGIDLWESSENTITSNRISSNSDGFYLQHSNNNTFQFNEIISNGRGIFLIQSSENFIIGNNASNNGDSINIYSSSHSLSEHYISYGNKIINNTITDNWNGISIENSNSNNVLENIVTSNRYGLQIKNSDGNILRNNIASDNFAGFYLSFSNGNEIIGNIAMNNSYGIHLEDFSNATSVIGNNVSSNYFGIILRSSYDNIFHHNNIFNNTVQLDQNDAINSWDDGNGEGNHWSDYIGKDDGSDGRIAGDGIGDTDLPHQGVDYYPLVEPVDLAYYWETHPDNCSSFFSELWFWGVILLVVIVIVLVVALTIPKKRKPLKPPFETVSHQNSQNQPKF